LVTSLGLTGWRAETVVMIAAICVGIRIEDASRDLLGRVHDDWCASLLDQSLVLELLDADDGAIRDCFLCRGVVALIRLIIVRGSIVSIGV